MLQKQGWKLSRIVGINVDYCKQETAWDCDRQVLTATMQEDLGMFQSVLVYAGSLKPSDLYGDAGSCRMS